MNYKFEVFRSFVTIRDMLLDRGYPHADDLNKLGQDEIDIIINTNPKTFVIDLIDYRILYVIDTKIKVANFDQHITKDIPAMIIVTLEKLNMTNLQSINNKHDNVQVFSLKELQINISKHELVPKHELVSDEQEIAKIVKAHNIKSKHHFPLILKTDPMSKYLNAKPGQLIKVTRKSPSAVKCVIYRCCA